MTEDRLPAGAAIEETVRRWAFGEYEIPEKDLKGRVAFILGILRGQRVIIQEERARAEAAELEIRVLRKAIDVTSLSDADRELF